MSTDRLPERPHDATVVQPYHVAYDATPHYQMPLSYQAPVGGSIELHDERRAISWVPDAYGQMVPMFKDQIAAVQPTAPRDLAQPQPLIDPVALRIGMGGLAAAGTGWGIGQALNALAGLGSAALMWLAVIIVAAKFAPAMGRATTVTNNTTNHITNHNRWFGKSTSATTTHNN